jgi:hypothetical protein
MARGKHSNLEYAIKFFLYRDAFERESRMYAGASSEPRTVGGTGLSQILPQVNHHS